MLRLSALSSIVSGILVLSCLWGCGSGHNSLANAGRKDGKGKLTVSFKWPTLAKAAKRHRFIPLESRSIVVTVSGPTGFAASSPPLTTTGGAGATSTYTFAAVPTGRISVTSRAFPNLDGTGTAQASATNPNVTIQADQTANLSLTMDTTIDNGHTSISGPGQFTKSRTADFIVTFQDGSGNTVLVNPSTVSWDTDDHSTALVTRLDPTHLTATVSGVSARQTTLHATYQEPDQAAQFPNTPNRSANFDIQVQPKIYICDHDNNNIVEVDNLNGDNRATLPPGGASYSFNQPRGVAVDSGGGVYVADTGANRLARVNKADGSDMRIVTDANGIPFSNLTAVAVDRDDNIYVLDNGNGRVVQFTYDPTGNALNFQQEFPIDSTTSHNGLAALNSGAFAYTQIPISPATTPLAAIFQFDGASTSFTGQGVVGLRNPFGIVANNGNFYVSDLDSNQVLQLSGQTSNNGTLNFDTITVSSRINAASGIALNAPRGLAYDGYDHLYIADTGNQRVLQAHVVFGLGLIFDSSGTYTLTGGSNPPAPYAVAVDQPVPPRF